MSDTFYEVRDIVSNLLDIDPEIITHRSRFQADLGADSLDLVELVMEFEEYFGGEISDEDAQRITTVGQAVQYIDARRPSYTPTPEYRAPQQPTYTPTYRQYPLTQNSVFISYNRKDWDRYINPLITRLEASGISVWVDQHLIKGGQDWMDEIQRALSTCNRMVLCVTKKSLKSKYVKGEYRYFHNNNKKLIPVICENAKLPFELQGYHYLTYDDYQGLLKLLRNS